MIWGLNFSEKGIFLFFEIQQVQWYKCTRVLRARIFFHSVNCRRDKQRRKRTTVSKQRCFRLCLFRRSKKKCNENLVTFDAFFYIANHISTVYISIAIAFLSTRRWTVLSTKSPRRRGKILLLTKLRPFVKGSNASIVFRRHSSISTKSLVLMIISPFVSRPLV